jgi:hypothetical protein
MGIMVSGQCRSEIRASKPNIKAQRICDLIQKKTWLANDEQSKGHPFKGGFVK